MSLMSSGGGRPAAAALKSMLIVATALSVAFAAHATNYNESSQPGGAFSSNDLNPTALSFTLGNNVVTGTTGGFVSDYLTFTVPTGEKLTAIDVLDGSQAPDRIFFGIASGGTVVVDPSFTSAAGLIGWTLFSNADDGMNVLPALGLAFVPGFPAYPGATGFTPPLGPGQYSLWIVDGDGAPGTAPYSLNFGLAVPEPSAWALLLAGFGGLGLMLRRGRESLGVGA